jgi:FHS family glucose/mannose:H+ symporter-like MFS transporter
VLTTPLRRSGRAAAAQAAAAQDFVAMLKLFFKPLVCVFVLTAFLYVLIEQSVGTWLPTFNNEILKLPAAMSVQVTSIFAACLAIGRLSAGVVMRKPELVSGDERLRDRHGAMVLLALPLTRDVVARSECRLVQRAGGDLPVPADRPVHGADLPGHQFGDAQLPAEATSTRR